MPVYIYKIACSKTDKLYVGQTTNSLEERFQQHKKAARALSRKIENDEDIEKWGCKLIALAMIEHGIDNFRIDLLEEVTEENSAEKETEYITSLNTIFPNGYNIMRTGGAAATKEKKQTISNSLSLLRDKDFDTFRVHNTLLQDLPKYCIHVQYPEKGETEYQGDEGVAVNKHPKCNRKFFSFKKYGGVQQAKDALLVFYNSLESLEEKIQFVKKEPELPAGLRKIKGKNYFVYKRINGVLYQKYFTVESPEKDAEVRQEAIDYLNSIVKEAKGKATEFVPKTTGPKLGTMARVVEKKNASIKGKGEDTKEYVERLKKEVEAEAAAKIVADGGLKLSKEAEDKNCIIEAKAAKAAVERQMENISNLTQTELDVLFMNKKPKPGRRGEKPLTSDELAAKVCDVTPPKTARDVAAEKKAIKAAKAAAKAAKIAAKAAKATVKPEIEEGDSAELDILTKLPIPPTKVDVKRPAVVNKPIAVKKIIAKK